MSAPGKLRVLALFTLIGNASSVECNQSGSSVVHLGYASPSFACLVITKSVRQQNIFIGGKLQESVSSLICFVTAEGSADPAPVFMGTLAHFCIPVSLYSKNVLLQCLINDNL